MPDTNSQAFHLAFILPGTVIRQSFDRNSFDESIDEFLCHLRAQVYAKVRQQLT